jgi:hypothetical protein
MRAARVFWLAGLLLLVPLPGCSLMNLDHVDARPCESNRDCARAQERAGLDPTLCGHCMDGLCDYRHRSEACNGEDDDCDGSIDEGISETAPRRAGNAAPLESLASATASVGPALTYVAVGGSVRRGFVVTEEGNDDQPAELRYDSAVGSPEHPCPSLDQAGATDCNFEELALAVDGEHLVYATINTLGCGAGQLRVGLADRRGKDSPFTVWLGDPRQPSAKARADLSVGVAARPDSCTGASLAAADDPPPGARSPAVASIDTVAGGEGALVVWLSARTKQAPSSNCSATLSVPVQALGVHVARGNANSLLGTDEGTPQPLGNTTSLAPPAVLPLHSPDGVASYLVGFASEEQGERGVRLLDVSVAERTLLFEPLAFLPDPFADRVVLAAGVGSEGELTVGVAWTSGCTHASTLHFSAFSRSRPDSASSPLSWEVGALRQAPQLLHRQVGFTTSEPRGGWFLLWAEQAAGAAEVRLARLLDDRSEPLNLTTLASGAFGHALLLPHGAGSVRVTLLDIDQDDRAQLETFPGWCGVRG